ncbi:YjbH domain-containing protein [Vibrio sp. Of14-4]|uniref:YjbH domain-containing protein n=1 Tax=Vibrio sp. Of14-4 TaxID=2724878 RepID=UPI001EF30968|nr:YjbH domain-containing protein [Vibrio sp. Of14-4]MCG7489679.1 YjbH domain-containing protein [Vibrio sp. Of14-4]
MNTRSTLSFVTPLCLLLSGATWSDTSADWKVSQSDFGGTGLMQTPTGRMAKEGEFNVGLTMSNDYQHYMVSLQLMEWLETTLRYTRVPDVPFSSDPSYSGDNLYTDRGVDFKIRLLEESYYLPETSIGVRDFAGTGLFDGEYIAATKRFGSLDFTLGLGWGYLGQSGNISNPACKLSDSYCTRPSDFNGSGGEFDTQRWFKGPSALFGGIEYQTPYEPLRLKVEYEGNDYSEDFPNTRNASKPMVQSTPWNFGVNYRLGDWGDAKLSYQRGNTVVFGLNLYANFNDIKPNWRDEDKLYSQGQLRPTVDDTDWQQVAEQIEKNAGYSNNSISVDKDVVTLKGEQVKYRDREQAVDRAATILTHHANESIKVINIVEQKNGMDLTQTSVDRKAFVDASNYQSPDANIADSLSYSEPDQSSKVRVATSKNNWDYGIDPVLQQSIGGPESFYLYSIGLSAKSNYWLTDNLELGGSLYFNLVDNYDKFNYVENSPHVRNYSTPRVRTMFRAYVDDNPVRLQNLQLTWFEQPMEEVYTQMYGGYLEMMFAGVGSEVLYRPLNTNWALGVDFNVVSQRDPDSWFGVYQDDYFFYDEAKCDARVPSCQAYVLSRGTTGHVTGYYMPTWSFLDSTLIKVSAGKFLGGDVGARVDVSKQFDTGIIVGVYATKTDLTAEEYGEGSYNKGFYISIPFDILTVKPSTNRAVISWEPLTRDGGQMLRKKHNLFDETDARSPWFQRPSSVN